MATIRECRCCHKKINIDKETNWIKPSNRMYYHVDCYNDWVKAREDRDVNTERTDDEWFQLLKDYISKDLKIPNINWKKVTTQWNNFLKSNKYQMTPKGLYFGLLYYYEVLHGDKTKAEGGIGIVPSIYSDSAAYWRELEARREGVLNEIVRQMAARSERPVLSIQDVNRRNTSRVKYSLDDVGGEDNE